MEIIADVEDIDTEPAVLAALGLGVAETEPLTARLVYRFAPRDDLDQPEEGAKHYDWAFTAAPATSGSAGICDGSLLMFTSARYETSRMIWPIGVGRPYARSSKQPPSRSQRLTSNKSALHWPPPIRSLRICNL